MSGPTFQKYPHLERMGHDRCLGIDEGICHIFPKIDGTNASVWLDPATGEVECGSRKRIISQEADNHGFWAFVNSCMPQAMALREFARTTGWRLYGEWLAKHTIGHYKPEAYRQFYLFDCYDPKTEKFVSFAEYGPKAKEAGLNVLEPLAIIPRPTEDQLQVYLHNDFLCDGSVDEEGNKRLGEGIVVKNYDWTCRYPGHGQVWAKIVRGEFKEQHRDKPKGAFSDDGVHHVEDKIVEECVTQPLVDKTLAKVAWAVYDEVATDDLRRVLEGAKTDIVEWVCINERGRVIPRLLETVWFELISEEMHTILKKFKSPTIRFKTLKRLVSWKTKQLAPPLFGAPKKTSSSEEPQSTATTSTEDKSASTPESPTPITPEPSPTSSASTCPEMQLQ